MNMIQLDLFQDVEFDQKKVMDTLFDVKELAKSTKESSDKVRKALFARHGELAKICMDLMIRVEAIERGLCQDTRMSK